MFVLNDCVLVLLHLERFFTVWMYIMPFSPVLTMLLLALIMYHEEYTINIKKKLSMHHCVMTWVIYIIMMLLVSGYITVKLLELWLTTQLAMNMTASVINLFSFFPVSIMGVCGAIASTKNENIQ